MNRVTLPGTGLCTTPLGFGCSALLGPKSTREAHALLATAYDAGIRHFDVARCYGFGDAERVLGEFLKECRDPVTVTTKFGIQPMKVVRGLPWAIGLARRVMRVSPGIRKLLGRRARNLVNTGAFTVAEARASLETSLQALGRERIDILLLHDCRPADCSSPELLEFLETEVRRGRIGTFGVGTDAAAVQTIAEEFPAFARVVQFRPGKLLRAESEPDPHRTVITHGTVSGGLAAIRAVLQQMPELKRVWSEQLGIDCDRSDALGGLLLAAAVDANPNGVVLFHSTRREAITANVATVVENRYSARQMQSMRAIMAHCLQVNDGASAG